MDHIYGTELQFDLGEHCEVVKGKGVEHHESAGGSCGAGSDVAGKPAILNDPTARLKKARASSSIRNLQYFPRIPQRLRQHRLQQPPALLIGLAELLLQLVAEG
jgi:hypothetical protein